MSPIVNGKIVDENFNDISEYENAVNHPNHYQGNRECIDVMIDMFGIDAVIGFCKCNAFKYRFRAGNKEGESFEKDIAKAEWYESKLHTLHRNKDLKKLYSGGLRTDE